MPQIHLEHPGFTYSACRPFTKNKGKIQKLKKKQEIHDIFIKKNYTKPVFSMIWPVEIYQKEQLLIKYYVIKHLILQKKS